MSPPFFSPFSEIFCFLSSFFVKGAFFQSFNPQLTPGVSKSTPSSDPKIGSQAFFERGWSKMLDKLVCPTKIQQIHALSCCTMKTGELLFFEPNFVGHQVVYISTTSPKIFGTSLRNRVK